jgi:hypothetical protein
LNCPAEIVGMDMGDGYTLKAPRREGAGVPTMGESVAGVKKVPRTCIQAVDCGCGIFGIANLGVRLRCGGSGTGI